MRWFVSLCATALFAGTPLVASANVDTCSATLLDAPLNELQATLGIVPGQAQELLGIRDQLYGPRAQLERELGQVQAELDQAQGSPWRAAQLPQLERQQAALSHELEQLSAVSAERALAVLTPAQHDRCTGAVREPLASRVVVVGSRRPRIAPRVVVQRVPPRVVRRPAPRVHRVPPRVVIRVPSKPIRYAPPVHKPVHRAQPAKAKPARGKYGKGKHGH